MNRSAAAGDILQEKQVGFAEVMSVTPEAQVVMFQVEYSPRALAVVATLCIDFEVFRFAILDADNTLHQYDEKGHEALGKALVTAEPVHDSYIQLKSNQYLSMWFGRLGDCGLLSCF